MVSANTQTGSRLLPALMVAATVLLLSACASAPVNPESTLTNAREAIANAEQAGARQYAHTELDEAQRKLTLAEEALDNEEPAKAERIAQESLVDAELALARAESAKAQAINQEMRDRTEAIVEEMQRTGE